MIQQWDVRHMVRSPVFPPFTSRDEMAKAVEHALEMIVDKETTIVELPLGRKLAWVQLGPVAQTIAMAQRQPLVFKNAVVQTLMEKTGADVVLECILEQKHPIVRKFEVSARGVDLRRLAKVFKERMMFNNPQLGYESIYWEPLYWSFGSRYDYMPVEYTSWHASNLLSAEMHEEGKPTIEQVVTTIKEVLICAG